MPRLSRIAPELPVADLGKALEYYLGRLGFRTALTMPDGQYAVVERDDVAVHLFQSADGSDARASIHVFVEGLEELYAELRARGAEVTQEIVRKPWGNRDFRVRDGSGNEIKFTEPLED